MGRRVAHHNGLLELGSLWKGAGGSGKGRGMREADDTYSYLCRTKRPQHRRRRRSLTTAKETAPAGGRRLGSLSSAAPCCESAPDYYKGPASAFVPGGLVKSGVVANSTKFGVRPPLEVDQGV